LLFIQAKIRAIGIYTSLLVVGKNLYKPDNNWTEIYTSYK